MEMEDVDKLLEEAAQSANRKAEEVKRSSSHETASRPGTAHSHRSHESRRRSRSPRRDRDRERDRYRRREDDRDHYRPGGSSRRSVSEVVDDNYYRPGRRDEGGSSRGDRDRRPRDSDRERDRARDHDRDRDRRDRRDRGDRDRGDDRRRGGEGRRGSRDHGRKTKTPELNDDERDSRTVFVQQLAARLRTKDLATFFSGCGVVKEAQIVKDRVSGRSKG